MLIECAISEYRKHCQEVRETLQDLNSTYGSKMLTSDFDTKRIQVLFKMADEKLFLVSHGYSR